MNNLKIQKKINIKDILLLIVIAGITIILDQFTKNYIKNNMFLGESIPILPNIFHITFIYNTGGAFGIFPDKTIFFTTVSLIAVVLLFIFYILIINERNYILKNGLALIFGGALGNLIDRYLYGKVVDFFDLRIWPIFNIADIAICIGMSLLILDMFLQKEKNVKENEIFNNKNENLEG